MLPCLSLLCFMTFGPPGVALEGMEPVAPTPVSVQGFGRTATCGSWSDGCTTCSRDASGASHCSTPGIACTPRPVACSAAGAD